MSQTKDFRLTKGMLPLLADLGISASNVLRRAGLPLDLFARDDVRVSTEGYFAMWRAMEDLTADPALPIHVAELFSAESFAPPIFAAMCSPNLTVALRRLSHYKRLVAPMTLDIERGPNGLSAGCRFIDTVAPPPVSLGSMEAAFIVRLARMGTREHIRPTKVVLPDVPAALEEHERFFGVQMAVGPKVEVSFEGRDADMPFLTADDDMWKIFEPELRRRLAALESSATTAEKVRGALLEGLPSGRASIGEVASQLGVSTRTLQRRLHAESTSYQVILNRTREQLAIHYLSTTELPCNEISFLLGYEEPNSFFRAFHEWTGDSPEHHRQQLTH